MIDAIKADAEQPLSDEKKQEIIASANQLKEDFSNTGYAHLSALLKAKLAVDADDLDSSR